MTPENPHHRRVERQRYQVVRFGRLLASNNDLDVLKATLAVLSRDGELPGYELVTRGAR